VKNDSNMGNKKQKKINKIKDQLAQLRAKLKASENRQSSFSPKPGLKKIKSTIKQAENKKITVIETKRKVEEPKRKVEEPKRKVEGIKRKVEEAKKKKARLKIEAKRKVEEAKKKKARLKIEAKRKVEEAKKKKARLKIEAKKKEEEAKKKEEEAKKKEEEAKRTYEEELEEQLSEEEIAGFQLEKTDMDKICNRVCEIIAGYETKGMLQSELWKKLKLSSRDGSRLALKLERMGMITREKILEKERWTYKLIIKKIPISTKSIEGSPCLTCPVEAKCSLDGEVSPKTCQWIEDWVMIELKNK
jgi:hypothetical protein